MKSQFESLLVLPQAYSLPHEWGHFSVSKSADQAYGLVPLTPRIVKGGIDRAELSADAVEIVLVGPDEGSIWEVINTSPREGATSRVYVSEAIVTATKGLHIVSSFERTRQEMIVAEVEKQAKENGVSAEMLTNSFVTEDGIPAREFIGQLISTTLIHHLYPALSASLVMGIRHRASKLARLNPFSLANFLDEASTIADDVHNDLCPEYFEHKFNRNVEG